MILDNCLSNCLNLKFLPCHSSRLLAAVSRCNFTQSFNQNSFLNYIGVDSRR
jgi:hypothetical protein